MRNLYSAGRDYLCLRFQLACRLVNCFITKDDFEKIELNELLFFDNNEENFLHQKLSDNE